ncbi:MAG: AI-2E family transporter [Alphaproteobacteria bacterium]|nr:AI-2E family transporter [Alphaproteobacteria bacterium]
MTLTHWIILGLSASFALLVSSLSSIFLPFLAGCIGAYALNPFVSNIEKRGLNRGLATAVVMLLFITLISIFFMILIPYMHQELFAISSNLPGLSEKLIKLSSPLLERLSHDFGFPTEAQLKTQISSHIGNIAQVIISFLLNILGSGLVLANIISLLILTPVVMFYFLKDWNLFLAQITKLIPRFYVTKIERYTSKIHTTLGEYAKGQMAVCLTLIVLYIILLTLIKLPDAFFIGFITGFLAFIPYLGALVGLILSLIVGFLHFEGWWQIFAILIVFGVVSVCEGYYLTPRLVGEKVGLHPVWIIFSLLAAATWFGFMGVIIALPVAAIIGTIVRLALEEYYASRLYKNSKA